MKQMHFIKRLRKAKQIVSLFSLAITINGCLIHSNRYWDLEFKKVKSCRKNWTYESLTQKTDLKVLLFNKQSHWCLSYFPNFIIGVTGNSDTIGIIDNTFNGIIKRNENISIIPVKDLIMERPIFSVSKKPIENNLNCSVKTIYSGHIDKKQ
jgi:hypothetical protein